MRPVSKTIRWVTGAFANSAAMAAGNVAAFASRATLPSRSTTQMCVSFIEMSKPAKYSMAALLLRFQSRFYRLHGEQPSHYPMLKKDFRGPSEQLRFKRRVAHATSIQTSIYPDSFVARSVFVAEFFNSIDPTRTWVV